MMIRTPYLIAPREQPDGTVSWEETAPDLALRIRDGDPTLGWLGDDRLSLHLNVAYAAEDGHCGIPRWEVWRRDEDGRASMVMSRVAHRIDGASLIRQLAAHDARTHQMADELLAARDARDKRLKADAADENAALADKLGWGLARDLDLPAPHGRVYPLGR